MQPESDGAWTQKTSSSEQKLSGKTLALESQLLANVVANHTLSNIRTRPIKAGTLVSPMEGNQAKLRLMHLIKKIEESLSQLLPQTQIEDTSRTNSSPVVNQPETSISVHQLSPEEIHDLFTKDRESSMAVQSYILTCSSSVFDHLVQFVFLDFRKLITDKFGNYILQKAFYRSQLLRSEVVIYCQCNFFRLACNEFASRCMQVLVEFEPGFRKFCLKAFEANTSKYISYISAVFLLSIAIRRAESLSEYIFVRKILVADPETQMASKYFKRILVTFVEVCPSSELPIIFRTIDLNSNICSHFREKFNSYLFLQFLEREYTPVWKLLERTLLTEPVLLTTAKYFFFMLDKLLSRRKNGCVQRLMDVLWHCRKPMECMAGKEPSEEMLRFCLVLTKTILLAKSSFVGSLEMWIEQQFPLFRTAN